MKVSNNVKKPNVRNTKLGIVNLTAVLQRMKAKFNKIVDDISSKTVENVTLHKVINKVITEVKQVIVFFSFDLRSKKNTDLMKCEMLICI